MSAKQQFYQPPSLAVKGMNQYFKDALAICRTLGHPSLFLTMTTNTKWFGIQRMLKFLPGVDVIDAPDVVARDMSVRLDLIILFNYHFTVLHVIEFQKLGLPHAHMLIWLHPNDRPKTTEQIDKMVFAEIPDPSIDPVGYKAVKNYMIHGPCGTDCVKSPCMVKGRCIEHFPKRYNSHTFFDDCGFPIYKRRKTGITVKKKKIDLDNRYVVPYNRDLLIRFQCHTNLENYNSSRSLKYLFKYCLKGHDIATMCLLKKTNNENGCTTPITPEKRPLDEVKQYLDERYVCTSEASWGIFGFNIHSCWPSIERLPIHLPNDKYVSFKDSQNLPDICDNVGTKKSKLEAWNKGVISFDDLKTVNGHVHNSFHEACVALGILQNDQQWHEAIAENAHTSMLPQLRAMFINILVYSPISHPRSLWEAHWGCMSNDIVLLRQHLTNNPNLCLLDFEIQNYALTEIEKLLNDIGKSLRNFPDMPFPGDAFFSNSENKLILEETSYNIEELKRIHARNHSLLNDEQKIVYESILDNINQKKEHKIVLHVASCGIDVVLLPGGRTAHSRFHIPLKLDEHCFAGLRHGTDIFELLQQTDLIIWDEAPMQHRHVFECVDRSLRDIMSAIDKNRAKKPFGGIIIIFGGDFQQLLHVIPKASRAEEIQIWRTRPSRTLARGSLLSVMVGVVVKLMRNLNQIMGLCNGTRMIVKSCRKNSIKCEILCGSHVGTKHLIPRIKMIPSDTNWPFELKRIQFLIQIGYAMIINKSQGQSLDTVELYLPRAAFSHGHIYVAISRVTRPEGLHILIDNDDGSSTNITNNVVFEEVFYNLPSVDN
ncbi:uncharacterized protein LOC141679997 [Apium graveolens]|uniref:uncharacterized protein LOC141679997 n=1 Tax=Apium graveolens TaxID=4045 RepID=UPI003D79C3B7